MQFTSRILTPLLTYWVNVASTIVLDQLALDGRCGHYHDDHLHFLRTVFFEPILGWIELGDQDNCFFFNQFCLAAKSNPQPPRREVSVLTTFTQLPISLSSPSSSRNPTCGPWGCHDGAISNQSMPLLCPQQHAQAWKHYTLSTF